MKMQAIAGTTFSVNDAIEEMNQRIKKLGAKLFIALHRVCVLCIFHVFLFLVCTKNYQVQSYTFYFILATIIFS